MEMQRFHNWIWGAPRRIGITFMANLSLQRRRVIDQLQFNNRCPFVGRNKSRTMKTFNWWFECGGQSNLLPDPRRWWFYNATELTRWDGLSKLKCHYPPYKWSRSIYCGLTTITHSSGASFSRGNDVLWLPFQGWRSEDLQISIAR